MNKIKELRQQKGITQVKLSKIIGVSRSAISMYEINASQPDYDIISKIADYFGVSVDYLLGRENKSTDLSQDERQLLTYFKQCDVIDQARILAYAEAIAQKEVYNNVSLEKVKKYWNLAVKRIIIYAPYIFTIID